MIIITHYLILVRLMNTYLKNISKEIYFSWLILKQEV
jgi:hypothetical protein